MNIKKTSRLIDHSSAAYRISVALTISRDDRTRPSWCWSTLFHFFFFSFYPDGSCISIRCLESGSHPSNKTFCHSLYCFSMVALRLNSIWDWSYGHKRSSNCTFETLSPLLSPHRYVRAEVQSTVDITKLLYSDSRFFEVFHNPKQQCGESKPYPLLMKYAAYNEAGTFSRGLSDVARAYWIYNFFATNRAFYCVRGVRSKETVLSLPRHLQPAL